MQARIRISTSPPNFYEPVEGDASYYCDIVQIEDWVNFESVAVQTDELKATLKKRGLASYLVHGSQNKEIGIVICYEDDDEGLMYCGIDGSGLSKSEPAVNEALWHVANAAVALPKGHRLKRDHGDPLKTA